MQATTLAGRSAADLARATPASRDRFLDLLRAASIAMVITGHWLIAAVARRDGVLRADNALAAAHWLQPATWVFQVMPVFFLVGGFTNARALSRPAASVPAFYGRRADRLLTPTLVLVVGWLVLADLLVALDVSEASVREGAKVAAQPLWFLAVYLLLIAVAPAQHALHRRNRWLAIGVLPVAAAAFDVLRLTGTASAAADANYLVVFMFAQEMGFWYADGAAERIRRPHALLAAAGAFALLVTLTTAGPYPVSMVGVPGEALSNMSPPTVVIVLLTVVQAGLLLAARPAIVRWLTRPRVWRATVAGNGVVLSLFLWHLTAFVAATAVLTAVGVPLYAVGSAAWWGTKPLWLAAALVALAALVVITSPVERRSRGPVGDPERPWLPALAVVLGAAGLAAIAAAGFTDILHTGGRRLLGVGVSPVLGVGLLAAGWVAARWRSRRPGTRRGGPGPSRG